MGIFDNNIPEMYTTWFSKKVFTLKCFSNIISTSLIVWVYNKFWLSAIKTTSYLQEIIVYSQPAIKRYRVNIVQIVVASDIFLSISRYVL